ncbi:tyrosine-type recombinase/integrase [Brevibacillus sp. NPDC003359]|uniref:tyrosine-type recombinase/integrase n=1 Tax=unclassified Brevibacillus TaxID=2684853 RepID=UPI0036C6E996
MKDGYFYKICPKGINSKYSLIVFDIRGNLFAPLTNFYDHEKDRIAESSARNYLDILIPFFDWLNQFSNYKGKRVCWDMEPDCIRVALKDYLVEEMYCKVRPYESFEFVHLTRKSPNTINRFLAAVKVFYKAMIHRRFYSYPNPLIDSMALSNEAKISLMGERKELPRMPSVAGTEKPLPHEYRRQTDSFFKIINEEWHPIIIDDPSLPLQIYKGGKDTGWRLRDEVITRLLFETGARATEVIQITIGDYRARRSIREASTFKGSHGRRVKYLLFSDDTYTLLMRYINNERKKCDLNGYSFEELPNDAPLFLTERGTAYTYHAWYPHWKKTIKEAGLNVNPHKARHWYVTNVLRVIYETSLTEVERSIRLKEFIRYMKWKSKETLEVYEHFFNEKEQIKLIEQVHQKMKVAEEEYKIERKKKTVRSRNDQLIPQKVIIEDEEILDFFAGLED